MVLITGSESNNNGLDENNFEEGFVTSLIHRSRNSREERTFSFFASSLVVISTP